MSLWSTCDRLPGCLVPGAGPLPGAAVAELQGTCEERAQGWAGGHAGRAASGSVTCTCGFGCLVPAVEITQSKTQRGGKRTSGMLGDRGRNGVPRWSPGPWGSREDVGVTPERGWAGGGALATSHGHAPRFLSPRCVAPAPRGPTGGEQTGPGGSDGPACRTATQDGSRGARRGRRVWLQSPGSGTARGPPRPLALCPLPLAPCPLPSQLKSCPPT